MSNILIGDIRRLGDFQPNHNWEFYVSDMKSDLSDDISRDLNLRCESIKTKITKTKIKHKITFVETVDGAAYSLLKTIIQSEGVIKINLLNRQDERHVTDVITLRKADCEINRFLSNGAPSDILRIQLKVETDI